MPASLQSWLSARSREELAALLRARPDLLVPAPRTLGVLAARAASEASLRRVLDGLDALTLHVLDALLLATPPASRAAVERLLAGVNVGPALDRLRKLAVIWGDDERLRLPAGLAVLVPSPGRLGRPLAALAAEANSLPAPPEVPRLVADLDEPALEVLRAIDAAGGARAAGRAPVRPDGPVRRLLDLGLLVSTDRRTLALPREVALALRGDLPLGPAPTAPPTVATREVGAEAADQAGAQQASEMLRLVAGLLSAWDDRPPPALKSGGLGVRELQNTARLIGQPVPVTALLVEVVYAAGLVDQDISRSVWSPTPGYDVWLTRSPAQQWSDLAQAWLESPRLAALVGTRGDHDRPLNALGPGLVSWSVRETRRVVLSALASLPPGTAAEEPAVRALLGWRAPRRASRWARLTTPVLGEAAGLGVTGRHALTFPGRELLERGPAAAAAALGSRLPAPLDQVVLQADLTAVAPGPLVTEIADELALLADVESAGAATVYRFSESSIRRAFDRGRTPESIGEFLIRVSRTPVPQPLDYLVHDIARRHGLLRSGSALSYLRSADVGLIAEVSASRATASLKLHRIAPTVLVSPVGSVRVLEVLRAAGYAPVAESSGGVSVSERRRPTRTPARPRWSGPEPPTSDGALAGLVDRLLAPPLPENGEFPVGVEQLLEVLEAARQEAAFVRLSWTDGQGVRHEGVLQPLLLRDGQLLAADAGSGMPRSIALRRVSSAAKEAAG